MKVDKPGSGRASPAPVRPLSASAPAKVSSDDDDYCWMCDECKELNSWKRFSCESCFSLKAVGAQKIKAEKKKKEDERSQDNEDYDPPSFRGRYVFKDGKYVYISEEEEEKQTPNVSSKYSFNYTKEKEYQRGEDEQERRRREAREREQAKKEKEEPSAEPRSSFGRYMYIGGKYVYVKDG